MTTVPITKAVSDELEPVGVSVAVNPVLHRVVIQVGDRAIGLTHVHAAVLAEKLIDAVQELHTLAKNAVKQ
jgi:hypothetical protein